MASIDLTPREKICFFTHFFTTKLNFSACSKKTSRKAVFWTISPGLFKRVSQLPELCALAHILFYVTLVRIRVFMSTLESNLVFIMILVHCT